MERAADQVEDEIKARASGAWPINRAQLVHTCDCYRLIIGFSPELPKPGMFVDEVLLVRDRGEEMRILRQGMHELAERLIVAGHFPHIRYEHDATMPHKIADVVADRYIRFLRFVFAGIEDALYRRAQAEAARANLPELTRDLDEWAEQPVSSHTPSPRSRRRRR